MGVWVRRLAGLLLFPFGWWVYQTLCVRTTFACNRTTSVCTLSSEGPGATATPLSLPLADVIGAGYEYSNVTLSPKAAEILAQARTMDDVHRGRLYQPMPGPRRQADHRVAIYTRRGIVPLTPTFAADDRTEPILHDFNSFIEDGQPARATLVVDESFRATLSAAAPCLLGVVLIVLPRKRPPTEK